MRTAAARWSRSPTSGNLTASSTSSITFCCPGKQPKGPADPIRSAGRCYSSPMLPQRWRRANLHVTQSLGNASRPLDLPTCSNRAGDALDQLALPDDLVDERAANLQRPSSAVSWGAIELRPPSFIDDRGASGQWFRRHHNDIGTAPDHDRDPGRIEVAR